MTLGDLRPGGLAIIEAGDQGAHSGVKDSKANYPNWENKAPEISSRRPKRCHLARSDASHPASNIVLGQIKIAEVDSGSDSHF